MADQNVLYRDFEQLRQDGDLQPEGKVAERRKEVKAKMGL